MIIKTSREEDAITEKYVLNINNKDVRVRIALAKPFLNAMFAFTVHGFKIRFT